MKQYEIWWATLPEPVGVRPVLLLSRNAAVLYLKRVIVAEITTHALVIPQEVSLGPREGLEGGSVARLDNLLTVPTGFLRTRLGRLAPTREVQVKNALGYTLGWPELVRIGSS